MCPGCRAILDAGAPLCPYCGWEIERTRVRREGGLVERALGGLGGATGALLAANIAMYGVTLLVAAAWLRAKTPEEIPFARLIASVAWSPPRGVLMDLGALVPEFLIDGGAVWLLLCPVFLHGGLIHLFFNMSALRNIGGVVEEAFGAGKALAVYLISGIAGSVASLGWFFVTGPRMEGDMPIPVPRVGASGAILGFVGVLAALGFRIGGEPGRRLWKPMVQAVGFIFVLGLILAFSDAPVRIDNAAHAGGLVAGLAAGWLCSFGIRARGDPASVRAWDAAAIVLSLLYLAAFVPVVAALARGE